MNTLMVGEDAWLNGRLNSYSVVSDSQVVCLAINANDFFKMVGCLGADLILALKQIATEKVEEMKRLTKNVENLLKKIHDSTDHVHMEVINCYHQDAKVKHRINLDLIGNIPVVESKLKNNIIRELDEAADSGITV